MLNVEGWSRRAVRLRSVLAVGLTLTPLAGCAGTGAPARYSDVAEKSALSAFLTAQVEAVDQEPGAAVPTFAAALAKAPDSEELARIALANALTAGDFEAAQAVAAAAALPEEPLARLTRAAGAFAKGRPAAALAQAQGVQGDAVQRVMADLLEAWSFAALGRGQDALRVLEALEASVRPSGLSALALDQQGLVLQRQGDFAAAEEAFAVGDPPLIRTSAVDLARAAGLVRLGRREAAAALLQARLDRGYDPAIERALRRLREGKSLPRQAEPGPALAAGVSAFAAALGGDDPAQSYVPYLTLALGAAPGQVDDLRLTISDVQRRLGRPRSAAAALAPIRAGSIFWRPAALRRASLLLEAERVEEGLALGREVAADGTEFSLTGYAELLRQAMRWAEAEAVFDRLFTLRQPAGWRLHFLRGVVRERQGKWPEAEADLQQAVALAPEQADVLNYLGYGWADRGLRLEEAIALLERAVRIQPRAAHIQDSLGWAYYKAGRRTEARHHLERAVVLAPQDPAAAEHLGDLYRDLNRLPEARRFWRAAVEHAESEQDRVRVQQKLSLSEPAEVAR